MEDDKRTIVEQEVEEVANAVGLHVGRVYDWVDTHLLTLESIYQLVAIVATLVLARLLHTQFKRLLQGVSRERTLGPVVQRLVGTVAAISLPVVWAIFLGVAISGFESYGLPIQFLRLVSSLLLAFVAIRVVSIFIPSDYWSQIFSWVAWSVAALNAVGLLDIAIGWLQATGLAIGDVRITAWTIVKGLILVTLLIWMSNAIAAAVERHLAKTEKMNSALRLLVVRLFRMALVFLAIIVTLSAVGVDLTVFAIFSGAVGVGIGLGLRRTVENLIASYTMLADESIKPGDVIEVETVSGPTYGQVRKMTTRYVAVRTRDGTETLIPNEVLMANPLTNWSHSDRPTRRRIPVGVSYDSDVELARKLCLEAAEEVPRVLRDPKPACLMRGFGDSSIDLELRFWIDDPENGVANVASEVMLRLWDKFQRHGIEIPYPQHDLRLRAPASSPEVPKDGAG